MNMKIQYYKIRWGLDPNDAPPLDLVVTLFLMMGEKGRFPYRNHKETFKIVIRILVQFDL
jgi:hypothetical protein